MDFQFIIDTLWDITKNVLGNRVDSAMLQNGGPTKRETSQAPAVPITKKLEQVRMFKTYDVVLDLAQVVNYVDRPTLHLLIEDEPSSHYNLAAIVLESQATGQWYLFSKGRVALQGSGGGKHNLDAVLDQLKSRNSGIAAWVLDAELLNSFEDGHTLWGSVRPHLIPLLSYLGKDHSWSDIQGRFEQLSKSAHPMS